METNISTAKPLIMGSNMAEAHPCAFYWPMQAKKKGAVTIHVDPRYTRTSAACDHHVHIRPETDIAFLSAVIRYILKKGLWFKEYVLAYTNASTIINPKFNFDDVSGLFNGWDPATRSYSKERGFMGLSFSVRRTAGLAPPGNKQRHNGQQPRNERHGDGRQPHRIPFLIP